MNASLSPPSHLDGDSPTGLKENQVIAQFEIGSMQNFIYLILDWKNKIAAIVDPQKDLNPPLDALKRYGFQLKSIILTHTHFDHTAGVQPLLKLYPDLILKVGSGDLHRLSKEIQSVPGLSLLTDGDRFQVGDLKLKAIHTPGHSAGAFSYYLEAGAGVSEPYLFTGDTIFIRDCGRTDLETGSNVEMYASIQKVKNLPKEAVFLVGHHYAKECASTLGRELIESPPLRCKSVEELASLP